jgi:hypothetical protein
MKFLEYVLGEKGWLWVGGFKGERDTTQKCVETFEEAYQLIDKWKSEERNIYFGCSRYNTDRRSQATAEYCKVFYLDVDCGPLKDYKDQGEGAAALRQFCDAVGLPKPMVINSGNGLHAYWVLENTIHPKDWKPVARSLKALCTRHKFYADPAVTEDEGRILRLPDSYNYKTDPPKKCSLITGYQKPINFFAFKNIVGEVQASPDKQKADPLTMALAGDKQSVFSNITTCNQIKFIKENQEGIDYNLWRAGLSIARNCADGEEAIHEMSKESSKYTFTDTVNAADTTIDKPYKCETFEKFNPKGCEGCPHKGNITSPIQLGNKVVAEYESDSPEEKEVLPELPWPYMFAKNGGIYAQVEEEEPTLVYEHRLYLDKRMIDPVDGEVAVIKHTLPLDGEKGLVISAQDVLSAEEAKKKLAHSGVIGGKKQMTEIINYIIRSFKHLQVTKKAEIMRSQFGWVDNDTKFILGKQELDGETILFSPPSSRVKELVEHLDSKGSIEGWKNIAAIYGEREMHAQAFGFFTGFGAPLLKFLNYKGGIINLVNNTSGTGKTTALRMAMSVWGDPNELVMIPKDTLATKIHRMGILNNISVAMDEVTNMPGEQFSDLVFSITQGRGAGRMKASANEERANFTKWATIAITTSNASMVDKLRATKKTPDGELMRFLEFDVPPESKIPKEYAQAMFDDALSENYGLVGPIYAQYIVKNRQDVIDEIKKVQAFIDKKVGFTSRERFWSAIIACNIGGARIAKRLGLVPKEIDIGKVLKWVMENMQVMRDEIQAPSADHAATIAEFINENRTSILVVNNDLDRRTVSEQLPILQPRSSKLCVRIEPDTQKMYVATKPFKKHCADNQITLRDVLSSLKNDGIYIKAVKKRIDKGLETVSPAVDCYEFDCSIPGFINTEEYISALQDENTGSELQD